MRLPEFLVIGAMKSGTTSLAFYMGQHPDVTISEPKELNFFVDPGNWQRGVGWYSSHFDAQAPFTGEASVRYTMAPDFLGAPGRIAQLMPDTHLIYLVRDPIDRMRSMYVYRSARNREEAKSLREAIERNPIYLASSRYDWQLRPYTELFATDQLLVVTTDELSEAPGKCLARVFSHIGADPSIPISTDKRLNQRPLNGPVGNIGLWAARVMKITGARSVIPRKARRLMRAVLSSPKQLDVSLSLEEMRMLRTSLAPDIAETRRHVERTGAQVPGWLQGFER